MFSHRGKIHIGAGRTISMEEKALMLYGYRAADIAAVTAAVSGAIGAPVTAFDASGLERSSVSEVLRGGCTPHAPACGTRFLMFVGFADTEILASMRAVTLEPRPLFCCLTPSNVSWEIGTLASHLEEEREACSR